MKDLTTLIREIDANTDFDRMRLDIRSQFGNENNPLLGATLLPETIKSSNAYSEEQVRYKTVLANAGTSYSPAQIKTGERLYGRFDVRFGNTNIADTMTADDLEKLMDFLKFADVDQTANLQAMATVLGFIDKSIIQPHLLLNEKYRWDAIIDGVVQRRGFNGYEEDVTYPNPSGHRPAVPGGTIAAPAGWYSIDDNYDPFSDIFEARNFLAKKGFRINRIISNFEIAHVFMNHPANKVRFGGIALTDGNFRRVVPGLNFEQINQELRANQLPTWEIYDRTYTDKDESDGLVKSFRYLERATYHPIVLVCTTGRNESLIDFGDRTSMLTSVELEDTLGYYGIGRVKGKPSAGRWLHTEVTERHPGGLYAEGIQEGLPVITEPEAFVVLKVNKPTT